MASQRLPFHLGVSEVPRAWPQVCPPEGGCVLAYQLNTLLAAQTMTDTHPVDRTMAVSSLRAENRSIRRRV